MSEFVHNSKTWPEEDSRWRLVGDLETIFMVRAYRHGLVAMAKVGRTDNADELYVCWQDEEQRALWEPEMHVNKAPGQVSCIIRHGMVRASVASAEEIERGAWWVSRVKVHDKHQREGHGKRLVTAMKVACAEQGADVVQVIPGGYNVPVAQQRAFYAACGFKPVNERGLMAWRPRLATRSAG